MEKKLIDLESEKFLFYCASRNVAPSFKQLEKFIQRYRKEVKNDWSKEDEWH